MVQKTFVRLLAAAALLAATGILAPAGAAARDKCRAGCKHAGCKRHGGAVRGAVAGVHGAIAGTTDAGYVYAAPRNGLFYNYYANGAGSVPAQLYLSPRPTPPLVGHTYITYEPLYPHEFLYRHHKTYYRKNGLFAANKTSVHWYRVPELPNCLSDNTLLGGFFDP